MDINMYEAQADIIDVDDIAEYNNNRFVLRRIKRNDANDNNESLWIQNHYDDYGEDCVDYIPEGANDMGWLGYFVGENYHLQKLFIHPFTPASGESVWYVLGPFFRGVSKNKSIRAIEFEDADLLGGDVFTMLTPFFQNNHNLTTINVNNCDFGDEGARLFALSIGSSTNKSLKSVELENNNIADEGMVDIITSLSIHSQLQKLILYGNLLRKNGCVALATLLRCSAKELQYLNISSNEINDEGIEALVPALTNCNNLEQLSLSNNPSITTRGWQSLASILESPNSNLKELGIQFNNVDDEAMTAFANALVNNRTLQTLRLRDNLSTITVIGWGTFSKVLCNTSSVNSTFLSNHTLLYMGDEMDGNAIIEPLLDLNERNNKKEIAMIKILKSHEDFDMQPFFEWEFKVLPLVLSWLERASEYDMPEDFEPNIEPRKLSTIYQFVRGMPVLYVETRLRMELEDIKAEESQLEEELKMQRESEELKHYLQKQKKLLEERKKSITKRIGKPNLN